MSEKRVDNIRIEGARLVFRNFAGKGSQYNDEGNRNFGVILDDELAERLKEDGWNVKYLKPRQDDPEQRETPWLSVKVKYGKIPPIATLINSRGKIKLDETTVGQLDWCIIRDCDLIIRPYHYPAMKGREAGISAYLKAIYVTIEEDEFDLKYGDLPDLVEETPYRGDNVGYRS